MMIKTYKKYGFILRWSGLFLYNMKTKKHIYLDVVITYYYFMAWYYMKLALFYYYWDRFKKKVKEA